MPVAGMLSRQMKALEHEIGGRLLERETSGVKPTGLGHALVKAMRPLIAHASSRMAKGGPARRRVLHLVFAPPGLPDGLQWHNAV